MHSHACLHSGRGPVLPIYASRSDSAVLEHPKILNLQVENLKLHRIDASATIVCYTIRCRTKFAKWWYKLIFKNKYQYIDNLQKLGGGAFFWTTLYIQAKYTRVIPAHGEENIFCAMWTVVMFSILFFKSLQALFTGHRSLRPKFGFIPLVISLKA